MRESAGTLFVPALFVILSANPADDLGAVRLVVQNRDRICRVCLAQRPGDHLRDIVLADHVQMPGNAHARVHGADRGDERRALLMRGAGRFRAGDLGKAGELFLRRCAVILQNDGENDSVCQSVRRIIQPAERVGNRVDVADF